MMTTTTLVDEVSTILHKAYQTKKPIEFISNQYSLDEATSYAVQDVLIKRRCISEKLVVAGYKISMTSAETQAIANTHEPAYGTLLTNNIVKSGDGVRLS